LIDERNKRGRPPKSQKSPELEAKEREFKELREKELRERDEMLKKQKDEMK